ncbi:lipoamide acyltransferase component of branched-chain alpha-keto acid dehydrogenase complex, mitochondrial-like [Ctenocephalides felis]|uniref:lipoamide acyltransferase component of branched-chain alpha-keto acid dehydrogenase complex, mitochondrial-like n=1 Tax=Ctenocephalides felis TaxID=7515 RepID=UPI000E6E2400|nr:lipoamide acyltransferase component of branched-chain alpha-keto acid dehydrogenase complex, mitochondrial-like [Ctenocephalides felis]
MATLMKCKHVSVLVKLINKTSYIKNVNRGADFHTSLNLQKIIPFNLSDIGEGIREVTVKEWFVKVGDKVEQFDNICEVQSDKASVTITSRYDGVVAKIHHDVDSVALVGKPLVDIDIEDDGDDKAETDGSSSSDGEAPKPAAAQKTETSEPVAEEKTSKKVLATPAVRRIAMQNKLDLSTVQATGRGGRVLKEDILVHLNQTADGKPMSAEVQEKIMAGRQSQQAETVVKEDYMVPIKGVQKVMFKTMNDALKIPHFACSEEINITKLVELRNSVKEIAAQSGIKLTFMPFFIKAASKCLEKYPILNSSIDDKEENIIFKGAHNITIAIDTPQGLVVPNVKNVQAKNILQIAAEVNRLQEAGLKNSLRPEDFAGGTFTLSNIGNMGGTYTHPVILAPQVSIGAIGKAQVLPRFGPDGESIVKAHILTVSWCADHRVIDGATMVNFSTQWKKYLENPNLLMLDL